MGIALALLTGCPESDRPYSMAKDRPDVAPSTPPPHWVARCAEQACVDFDPDGFDPKGLSGGEPSGLLLEVQGPGTLSVTMAVGAGRCGCDPCDEAALPGPQPLVRSWELERGRQLVDVALMVDDWAVQSIDATATLGGTTSRVQASGWAICQAVTPD